MLLLERTLTLFPYTTLFRSVGIAVAGASDITAEAADVVYLPHSLEKLPRFFEVSRRSVRTAWHNIIWFAGVFNAGRSEEHTSELQSHSDLVCRLLLEKKKYN